MMAAATPPGSSEPSRRLSDATHVALREAIASAWMKRASDALDAESALVGAVHLAARESRSRALRPEEMLLEFKHLEAELASVFPSVSVEERRQLREWLVTRGLRAFFHEE